MARRRDASDDLDAAVSRAVISGAAQRQRAYRRREANGLACWRVEGDQAAVEAMLIESGDLAAWDTDDRASVEAALTRFVARHARYA